MIVPIVVGKRITHVVFFAFRISFTCFSKNPIEQYEGNERDKQGQL